ncbi:MULTISPECIES: 5-(carboxyamino)imidazole ribonucleotide mutase [unclassified Fusibacter]|uniref:5-(carboxyamino)imidazole ribonucleotide mutase n=1 Tax=unclassified Fusibacter TaxID=2624464 RepID=UPI0010100D6E|nr:MULTISPECIES: 5-(carboxyamino)imidazole ribonucleotide mutase [unclassified Fusibacter]MCK8059613.1 5-(carboxyamino)imidazole ribonucleotide mutase [Fusibacter sp. A2]NPE21414.1 5-(carboxyamino)imidazole ribonucleotide mutase [Fusibacter sp. A1]RXV61827.1 5-(carboxyamino)imidazole ribonucleotide mutase [Fusibacter sp. A1]
MKVAILMGSDSDYSVVKGAIDELSKFGVESVVRVLSAHRTPHEAVEFVMNAEDEGIELFIGCAGKAAHLAGVIAGVSSLPVIGLPIKSSTMDGLDSLLSMVQMPSGVPVATVAINGSQNAGLLAVQILSLKYPELRVAFKAFKKQMADEVHAKNAKVQEMLKA